MSNGLKDEIGYLREENEELRKEMRNIDDELKTLNRLLQMLDEYKLSDTQKVRTVQWLLDKVVGDIREKTALLQQQPQK